MFPPAMALTPARVQEPEIPGAAATSTLAGRVSTIALASVSGVAFGLPKVIVKTEVPP